MSRSKIGKVYLVGAGPGDLGLVTLRAKECIERADVIVNDHLANPEMLGWARDDAEIIYAGKKAGEQRLVAKGSIGIGGHMNQEDEELFNYAVDENVYRAGVEREVDEEIKIESPFEDRIVALLNDDTTEVGRVHLGIVHVFRLAEPKVQKREAMITNLFCLDRDQLVALRDNLETWSQLCVDSLGRLLS